MTQDTRTASLDDRVITAAAQAMYAEQSRRFGTHDHPPEIIFEPPEETERAIFTAAIKAADATRAPEIIAAVDELTRVSRIVGIFAEAGLHSHRASGIVLTPEEQSYRSEDDWEACEAAARRDLLAIFGITDPA